MWRGLRRVAAGGVGLVAVFGVAACGSGGGRSGSSGGQSASAVGQAGAAQAVETAYRSTAGEKTAAFRIEETVNAAGSGGASANETITGSGQADLASHAFSVSMNNPSGAGTEIIWSGGMEYVRLPASQRSTIPGHKPWVGVNMTKVAQAKLRGSSSELAAPNTSDPGQALAQLAAVSSGVSKAGAGTVAGVPVTGYRAHLSLDKLASQVQAMYGTEAAQGVRQEEQILGTSLPVQVWVDAQHLVRQIRYQIPVPAAAGGSGGGTATETMTFTSFGAPVTITPPPASQVADITGQAIQHAQARSG